MIILLLQASNGIIGISCFIIFYQLCRLLVKRWRDGIPFRGTIALAAALFFFGGTARLIMTYFINNDSLEAVISILFALTSLATAALAIVSVDRALKMKTPRQYDELEAEKDRILASLRRDVQLLEKRR